MVNIIGVPITIGIWRGAKQGWDLSLLRETGLNSRHRNLDLLMLRLHLVCLLLAADHPNEDSLI